MPDNKKTIEEKNILFYENDRFAVNTTGIKIISAAKGSAECILFVTEKHLNALGVVMGGAIFTLADFTFTLAANVQSEERVSTLNADISFLRAAACKKLVSRASLIKDGKNVCVYNIDITNEDDKLVACVRVTGFKAK